jgi:hypothetical protein
LIQSGNQYGNAPLQQDGTADYVDDAQIYEYEHGDQQQQQNGGDVYADAPAQGHGQGHARQGSGGGGGGQQNSYYYAQGSSSKRHDDDDENGDMW